MLKTIFQRIQIGLDWQIVVRSRNIVFINRWCWKLFEHWCKMWGKRLSENKSKPKTRKHPMNCFLTNFFHNGWRILCFSFDFLLEQIFGTYVKRISSNVNDYSLRPTRHFSSSKLKLIGHLIIDASFHFERLIENTDKFSWFSYINSFCHRVFVFSSSSSSFSHQLYNETFWLNQYNERLIKKWFIMLRSNVTLSHWIRHLIRFN